MKDGMATCKPAIQPLPGPVRSQIKSSVEITTLSDVVEQLFQNSLDANSTDVRIEVDFKKAFCAVTDNGYGIPAAEFGQYGNLARPYCTSKSSCEDSYGNSGQSLAHISALAFVSITSRVSGGDARQLLLHHSRRVHNDYTPDEVSAHIRTSGTSVVVQNLFGKLPVRFKAQALLVDDPVKIQRQFHQLKMRLVGYLLAYPRPLNLRLSVKGSNLSYTHKVPAGGSSQIPFSTDAVQNVMRQAGLASATEAGSWKLASARATGLTVRAVISMVPHPSKDGQCISLGHQPVQRTGLGAALSDKINGLFETSAFRVAHQTKNETLARPNTRSRPGYNVARRRGDDVKGVDRWPCFYVRIDVHSCHLKQALLSHNEAEGHTNNCFQQIMALLTILMEQMLQSRQLMPQSQQARGRRTPKFADMRGSPIARDSFDSWTRARAAHPREMEDLRQGLPFVNKNESSCAEFLVDDDVQMLLDDVEREEGDLMSATPITPQNFGMQTPVIGEDKSASYTPPDAADENVLWADPQTGKIICLNSNSFAIPQRSRSSPCGSLDTHDKCQKHPDPSQPLPKISLPLHEISDRLRQWPTGAFRTSPEAAIITMAMNPECIPAATQQNSSVAEESLSAHDLVKAEVVGQVDQKFILARVHEKLILIDQHAADERIKVEALYKELSNAHTIPLRLPILIECSEEEARRFDQAQAYFASWAIYYRRSEMVKNAIRVTLLPSSIAERCRQEPKLLIDLLRKEVWADNRRGLTESGQAEASWVDRMAHCPSDLLDMINSRACRSAIMFNDALTTDQCTSLIRSLAHCALPFQCAHGRPSLAILTNLERCGLGTALDNEDFGNAFRNWV